MTTVVQRKLVSLVKAKEKALKVFTKMVNQLNATNEKLSIIQQDATNNANYFHSIVNQAETSIEENNRLIEKINNFLK